MGNEPRPVALLDQLAAEMKGNVARLAGDPDAVRTCVIVVETGGERPGQIVACSSDPRQWVGQALLNEAVAEINKARGGR